jgi:hypothetical protein
MVRITVRVSGFPMRDNGADSALEPSGRPPKQSDIKRMVAVPELRGPLQSGRTRTQPRIATQKLIPVIHPRGS